MSDLCSDLKNTSCIESPDNTVVDIYEQYVCDLGDVLDRHAPLVSRLTKKESADWLSDSYQHAKSLSHQFERTWRRAKNPLGSSSNCSVQWLKHMHVHNLDNLHQCATGHSTETALLSIKNEAHLSFSRGEPTALILLDLSAAFDIIALFSVVFRFSSDMGYCSQMVHFLLSTVLSINKN